MEPAYRGANKALNSPWTCISEVKAQYRDP